MSSPNHTPSKSIGLCLALTLAGAVALAVKDPVAAQGVALGAGSGALGFWLMARRLQTIGAVAKERLQRTIYEWMIARMAIYALAFAMAYTLDRTRMHGLIGAVAGSLVLRALFIGVTVIRNRRNNTAT